MITEQLVAYIKEQLGQGTAKEAITGILIAQGWQKADIDSAFAIAGQSQGPVLSQTASVPQQSQPAVQMQQPVIQQSVQPQSQPMPVQSQVPGSSPQQIMVQDLKPAVVQQPVQPQQQLQEQPTQSAPSSADDPNDTKGMFALVSIIAGVVSIISNFLPVRGATALVLSGGAVFVFAIAAIVLGVMGLKSSRRLIATIGMVLGILGIIVFVSLFVYGLIVGIARTVAQQNVSASPAAQTLYTDSQHRFSMMPPAGWQTDASGQKGTLVIFMSPTADSVNGSSFRSNINVVSGSLNGKTLDQYVDEQKAALGANFQDFSLVQDNVTVINGMPARILGVTFTTNGLQLHDLQASVADGDTVYVVTASTLDSTWAAYQASFANALNSFALGTAVPSSAVPGPQALLSATSYHDQKNGFSIDPPRSWKMDVSGSFGTLALFMSPAVENTTSGTYVTNISIASLGAKGLTLDAFVDVSLQQSKAKAKNFAIVSDSHLVLNGMPVRLVEETLTDGTLQIHDLQLFALKNNIVYLVTGNTLDKDWSAYGQTLRASLNTFQLD